MDKLVQVVDCLTKEECDAVLSRVNLTQTRGSTIFNRSGAQLTTSATFRSSTSLSLSESAEETQLLHERINASLLRYKEKIAQLNNIFNYPPVPGGIGVRCYREAIQIIRYARGQKYEFHRDTPLNKDAKEHNRTISVVVYLNDEFEGGGTEFIHQVIKPNKGQAIIFPSGWTHPHMGQEVIAGEKIIAATWYYSS